MNLMNESKRILHYLGLSRDEKKISDAIQIQSFNNRKKEFLKQGEASKANFLRKGQFDQWKNKLNRKQKNKISVLLYKELKMFGYSI